MCFGSPRGRFRPSCPRCVSYFSRLILCVSPLPHLRPFSRILRDRNQANNSLYTFTGNFLPEGAHTPDSQKQTLSPSQVLLRGSSLRNTEWIVGVAIYTGHDSKVMMNATSAPSKRSSLERQLDLVVVFMFSLLLSLCIIGSVTVALKTQALGQKMWYLALDASSVPDQYNPNTPGLVGLENFVNLFILYAYLIPISLYVSVEMVKVTQAMVYINFDRRMYDRKTDTPALARTSNLNEELGMVDTVLSDKTGTLTCNLMEFFKCSIAGVQYGTGTTEIERAAAARTGKPLPPGSAAQSTEPLEKGFNFHDKRLEGVRWLQEARPDVIKHFFRLLAVCHTAIPEGEPTEDLIKYQAESPDEAAFVVAAKRCGHFFYKRTPTTITVRETTLPDGKEVDVEYEILNILEFNSTRKRMSVIFRQLPDGRPILYCKGADTVIYERLAAEGNEFSDVTTRHMEEYGEGGLRTLCLAYAELDPAAYAAWDKKYVAARTALEGRDALIEAASELIERDLILLGSTAIEDKLQEGVPRTIEKLAAAGIKLWVLTGDKQETAINIGFACSLLTNDQAMYVVDANADLDEPNLKKMQSRVAHRSATFSDSDTAADPMANYVREQLREAVREICASDFADEPDAFSLVIDGKALTYALRDDIKGDFLALASRCKAVICCRVSPLQKALVTLLVKSRKLTTLAIGDGANDVGMIQAADIGVGISGQEGMQAVMAADFAIAQFRYLERLLLVHGRYNYKRIARMVGYFFYKNTLFGFTLFWFNLFCFSSGQIFFNQWFMSGYNVLFTLLPVLVLGIMDQARAPGRSRRPPIPPLPNVAWLWAQLPHSHPPPSPLHLSSSSVFFPPSQDVSPETGTRFSPLYRQGLANEYFSFRAKATWVLKGLMQSVILFFGVCLAYNFDTVSDRSAGTVGGLWKMGQTLYTCINLATLAEFLITINYLTWIHAAVIGVTFVLWYIGALMVWAAFPLSISDNTWHLFLTENASTPMFWLLSLLLPVMAVMPTLLGRALVRIFAPSDDMIVQEVERLPGMKERLAADPEAHAGGASEIAQSIGVPSTSEMRVSDTLLTAGRMHRNLSAGPGSMHELGLGHGAYKGRVHTGFVGGSNDDTYGQSVMSPTIANLESRMKNNPFAGGHGKIPAELTSSEDEVEGAAVTGRSSARPVFFSGCDATSRFVSPALGRRPPFYLTSSFLFPLVTLLFPPFAPRSRGANTGRATLVTSSSSSKGLPAPGNFNSAEMLAAAEGVSLGGRSKPGAQAVAGGRHYLEVQKRLGGAGAASKKQESTMESTEDE